MVKYITTALLTASAGPFVALDGISGQADESVGYVQETNRHYRWFASAKDTANGDTIIIPDGQNPVDPGRWFLQGPQSSLGIIPDNPVGVPVNAILRGNSSGDGYSFGPALLDDEGVVTTARLRLKGSSDVNYALSIRKETADPPFRSGVAWLYETAGQQFDIEPSEGNDSLGIFTELRFVGQIPGGGPNITRYGIQLRPGFGARFFSNGDATIGGKLLAAGAAGSETHFVGTDQESPITANTIAGRSFIRGGNLVATGAFEAAGGSLRVEGGAASNTEALGSARGAPVWVRGGRATGAGTRIQGNVAIGGTADATAFNYQNMEDGIHIQEATTAPNADPIQGVFMFVNPATDLIQWRQPAAALPVLNGGSGGNALAEQIRDVLVSYGLASL